MRALFLSFLTALIVLTSAGFGLARGIMPADQGIVICQGHAAVTIWIDAQGNEVEHQHLCPDEASFFKQGALQEPRVTAPEGTALSLTKASLSLAVAPALAAATNARDPPLPV
ncbi:MAG: hypothetical protein MK180_02185 [Rhodobacteraceae bacterium]|nr:hypothetical protein [Paracoccaceae bacterium]